MIGTRWRHAMRDANHLTRGLAARPRHRWRPDSAPSAPHRPRASSDMNVVRLRLAPQPRSLVGAMCAHTRSHQSRTPRRGWPATGAGSWDGPCTPPDDSLFNEPWLRREPQPRFPRGRARASDQSSECRGSARAPPRHDRRTRTSAFSASRRCVARSLTWPNGQPRHTANACMPACVGQAERGPPIPTRGSHGPRLKFLRVS